MGFRIYSITPKRHPPLPGVYAGFYASRWFIQRKERCEDLAWWADRHNLPILIEIGNQPNDIRRHSEDKVLETIEKFREVIGWLRNKAPNGPIGIFATLPIQDRTPDTSEGWREANEFLQPLAELVDWICPELFMHADYPDPGKWQAFAEANITEARIYGKPVYPFLAPQYHPGRNKALSNKVLPASFWRRMLELCRDECDGAILFAFPGVQDQGRAWQDVVREFAGGPER